MIKHISKKLNDQIIQAHQDIKLDPIKSTAIIIDPILSSIFFLIANTLFLSIYYNTKTDLTEIRPLLMLDAFISSVSFFTLFISGLKLKEIFFYYLHYFLLGKSNRTILINDHIKEKVNINKINNLTFLDDEKFKNITTDNLRQWTNNHLGKSRSIHNLINTRVHTDKNKLSLGLIYWTQLIPKSRLNIDELRSILQSCQIVEANTHLQELKPIPQLQIEAIFSLYKPNELVRLFTSPYYIEQYLLTLKIALQYNLTLPVKNNISNLYYWTKEVSLLKEGGNFEFNYTDSIPWIKPLTQDKSIGIIEYIHNQAELERWGFMLSNCLRTNTHPYKDKLRSGMTFIFGLWRDNQAVLIFELNRWGGICEVKKRANAQLSSEELSELLACINKHITK